MGIDCQAKNEKGGGKVSAQLSKLPGTYPPVSLIRQIYYS
jgi:hypothetical protein